MKWPWKKKLIDCFTCGYAIEGNYNLIRFKVSDEEEVQERKICEKCSENVNKMHGETGEDGSI